MSKPATFTSLAPEIHQRIATLLHPRTQFALRCTCSRLYNAVPTPSHKELLTLERSLPSQTKIKYKRYYHNDAASVKDRDHDPVPLSSYFATNFLACKECLRLRHKEDFTEAMRGQLLDSPEPEDRICIECGVKNGIEGYKHGDGFRYDYKDMQRVMCADCAVFPAREGASWRRRLSECWACYADREKDAPWKPVGNGPVEVTAEKGPACLKLHHGVSCSVCSVRFARCSDKRVRYVPAKDLYKG